MLFRSLVKAIMERLSKDTAASLPGTVDDRFKVLDWNIDSASMPPPTPLTYIQHGAGQQEQPTVMELLATGDIAQAMDKLVANIDYEENRQIYTIFKIDFVKKMAELVGKDENRRIQELIQIQLKYLRCRRFLALDPSDFKRRKELCFLFNELHTHLEDIQSWEDKYGMTLLMNMVATEDPDAMVHRNMRLLVEILIRKGVFVDEIGRAHV